MEDRFVYADNAATTAVVPEAVAAMTPYLTDCWGNPSSMYSKGREARTGLDAAREKTANVLGCAPNEIYFTSGGTEADNWAVKGGARFMRKKYGRSHVITSVIEHPAVLRSCDALEREGFRVTRVAVHENGIIDMDKFKAALDDDTAIVAVMYANNEIGTIQPVEEIAKLAHEKGALMFTDAVQAVGSIPVNVKSLGVDMLALSGHKFGAPKGIGALYIRRGLKIEKYIDGGGQERMMRSGTENLAGIVALATALELAVSRLSDMERIRAMRDRLADYIMQNIPHTIYNGDREHRLPGNLNISFEYIEGESLLLLLDMAGICISTGSACSSNSLEPSHVLLATGLPAEKAHGSMRVSLSHCNTDEDIDYIIEKLPPIVSRLRAMSPIYPGDNK